MTDTPNLDSPITPAGQTKRSPLVWVALALWFCWLTALIVLSYPEWGKSKTELLEAPDHEK